MIYAIFVLVRDFLSIPTQNSKSILGGFPMEDNKSQFSDGLTDQAKVVSLFQFIQELNKLKQKAVLNIKEYPWTFFFSNIPSDLENIHLCYQDRVSEDIQEKSSDSDIILSVHKPEFQKCPTPELPLELWLAPGWVSSRRKCRSVYARKRGG